MGLSYPDFAESHLQIFQTNSNNDRVIKTDNGISNLLYSTCLDTVITKYS